MLKDLYIYEIALLFLGALLFIILSGALVYYVIKKEEIKKLLLFFPIAILMIAYPSIKELNISSDKLQLTKYQNQYENNPDDSIAKEKIEELTDKLTSRANSEEDLVQISKSNILLDEPEKALEIAEKVIKKSKKKPVSTIKDPYIKQAYQLKEIASIQQKTLNKKDTLESIKNLNNLKLDPELTKISSVLKKRYSKGLKQRTKSTTE